MNNNTENNTPANNEILDQIHTRFFLVSCDVLTSDGTDACRVNGEPVDYEVELFKRNTGYCASHYLLEIPCGDFLANNLAIVTVLRNLAKTNGNGSYEYPSNVEHFNNREDAMKRVPVIGGHKWVRDLGLLEPTARG